MTLPQEALALGVLIVVCYYLVKWLDRKTRKGS